MKINTFFGAMLFVTFIFFVSQAKAQNALLIYTKFPTLLTIESTPAKSSNKTPIWKENDGGYVLNYADMNKTFISSETKTNFRISSENKLSKYITIEPKEKVSLFNCLNDEKYCCEKLSDKQKKATDKIYAVAVMKKSAMKKEILEFSPENRKGIISPENIDLSWFTESRIEEIYIVDVNTVETVWKSNQFNGNRITFAEIKEQLQKPLELGHTYQLNILMKDDAEAVVGEKKFTSEFEYNSLAFNNNEYYFTSQDAVHFEWNANAPVSRLFIKNQKTEEIIWQTDQFSGQFLDFENTLKQAGVSLNPEIIYQFVIELKNMNLAAKAFTYPFEVLLDNEESAELKKLIGE